MEIDWQPFELHPETPPGGQRLDEYFPPERLPAMHAQLRRFAASFGLEDLKSPERFPNTRRVLAAAEYAREIGRLDAFRSAAMNAYWREGRGLETDDELRFVGERAGVDPEAVVRAASDRVYLERVLAARAEGVARGVSGIPTFFVGTARPLRIVGCQPAEVLIQAARSSGAVSARRPGGG